jgi:hypothetical protein
MINDVETDDYMSVKDAALSLCVSPGALRLAIHEERIPSELVFGRRVIKRSDVEEYRQRTQPDGQPVKHRPKGATDRTPRKPRGEQTR